MFYVNFQALKPQTVYRDLIKHGKYKSSLN